MTMTPVVAGMHIAGDLHEFEALLAQTIAQASKLTATMTRARAEFQTAPSLGHKTLLYVARVQSALLNANGDTARVHESLRGVAREMGIVYENTPASGILGSRAALTVAA